MLATPLQLANATAALSQKGRRFKPHLLHKKIKDNGKTYYFQPIEEYPVQLQDNHYWEIVIEALQNVIHSREGTANIKFGHNTNYSVAGKTGTAQVFSGNKYEKARLEDIPKSLRDHSLFIAFAPVEKPEIALAILVENEKIAAIVARKILDAYFQSPLNTEQFDAMSYIGTMIYENTKSTSYLPLHPEVLASRL